MSLPPVRCAVCRLPTDEPRRGLCPICDERLRGLLAVGESCALCGLADGRVLRPARLGGEVLCLCRNHAWIAETSSPRPTSLEELRAIVVRPDGRRNGVERRVLERRRSDRRAGAGDRRVASRMPDKPDRRLMDRRTSS